LAIENQYPPKFSQQIRYPAVYNLDELPMPPGMDFNITNTSGIYFNVWFDTNTSMNSIPELSYGKHKFDIYVIHYQSGVTAQGFEIPPDLPPLKSKSRILFELKDSVGTVLYSDTTPFYSNNSFSGYVWIKQDPLRTYDDIVDGDGWLTIVGKTNTNDPEWRNRYNVRVKQKVNLHLYQSTSNGIIYYPNNSPVIFQQSSASFGSGSGAFQLDEVLDGPDNDNLISYVEISSSKLETYSGELGYIQVNMKVSGSEDDDWTTLRDHPLGDAKYEDDIHSDYSQGINTLSEQFQVEVPNNLISNAELNHNIRFQLLFKNIQNQFVGDYTNTTVGGVPTGHFEVQWPSATEWTSFRGSDIISSTGTNLILPVNSSLATTCAGNFSFRPNFIPARSGGGAHYDTTTHQLDSWSSGDGPGEPGAGNETD